MICVKFSGMDISGERGGLLIYIGRSSRSVGLRYIYIYTYIYIYYIYIYIYIYVYIYIYIYIEEGQESAIWQSAIWQSFVTGPSMKFRFIYLADPVLAAPLTC